MKRIVKWYRLLKPVAVYTSYLFTASTVCYLGVYELSGRQMFFGAESLWGFLGFSLGSILLQRIIFGQRVGTRLCYLGRLLFYIGSATLWGMACLRFWHVAAFPVVLIGVFSCLSLELFNRYRAHMYNTLLQQYKKRKQICSTKSE